MAAIAWSWFPFTGLFLLVSFCGLYFFIDKKSLNQWRQDLFASWEKKEIDFNALYDAVIAISTLPKNTVESMLETLPSAGDLVTEQSISQNTRKAIAAVVTAIHACRSDDIAVKTSVYTFVAGSIIFAAAFWMWQPLLGLVAVGLIFLLRYRAKKQRLKKLKEKIITMQQESDFNPVKFLEIIDNNKIQWTPITAEEKQSILSRHTGTM